MTGVSLSGAFQQLNILVHFLKLSITVFWRS